MTPFILFNLFLASSKRFYDPGPTDPPGKVSIVVPAYKEPCEFLRITLESLRNQRFVKNHPDYVEIILVDGEPCHEKLRDLYDRHVKAPRGKLRARHAGILASRGDIIVSVDADTYYPPQFLDALLKPFHDREVVLTSCIPVAYHPAIEAFFHYLTSLHALQLASGRGSAFRKEAYFRLGGFPLEKEYRTTYEMQLDEEYAFRFAMRKLGKVVHVPVVIYHLADVFDPNSNLDRGLRKYLKE